MIRRYIEFNWTKNKNSFYFRTWPIICTEKFTCRFRKMLRYGQLNQKKKIKTLNYQFHELGLLFSISMSEIIEVCLKCQLLLRFLLSVPYHWGTSLCTLQSFWILGDGINLSPWLKNKIAEITIVNLCPVHIRE